MTEASKPVGIMPNHLDLREITFTNLLLLDFNPADMESKYRVVFNRDMFALPNKKAMEVVMHFLFTRLHPQLAYEEFRDCWPVRDKVLEQQFRKVCFNWVSRIQKEDAEARLPRIVQSLFHSPGGDRFYSFLHHFSLYILTKVMYRDHGKIISIPTFPTKTVHNHSFTHVMSKALEAHYIVLKKRFIEFTQHAVEVEHHWKEFAMESTKEFRSLVKKKRDLERQVMELDGMIGPRGTNTGMKTDYQEEVEALKRTQTLQKIRDLWAGITEFHSVQAPQRRIVDSVLNDEANKYHIDASEIQPRVPDLLLRDCEREIRKRNIEDTYIGGKVNLFSLIQLWNLSLSKIKEQILQEPLPSFENESPTMRSALHTHHAHLTNAKSLRAAIEETMPSMKESIKELKLQCYRTLEQKQSKPSGAPVLFNLGLVPPTPPVSFAAADTPAAERITSFQESLKMSPDTVCTPDVIQAWTKSARRKQLHDKQESVTKLKDKKAVPSRLPRPHHHLQPDQAINAMTVTSKSTERRTKKPSAQVQTETSVSYPHHVTPKAKQVKNGSKDLPVNLKPQNILADQIADAVAMTETTSSSLSSSATSSRSSTPKAQALVDPVGALGQDAFQPRDRIPRTPAKAEPSGFKDSAEKPLRHPRTDTKPGRFLETILDESAESASSIPVREDLSMESSPQAVTSLSWSDVEFPPNSLRTSLFHETPSEHHGASSTRPNTFPDFSDVKLNPNAAVNERFNRSIGQPTPKSVKKALFEGSPHSQEMTLQQQHATPRYQVTRQTPMSARVPLFMEPSPQLDFWLLPQDRNLDNSGVHATPMSARRDLFEETPLESGNSSFNGIEYLSRFGEQAAPETDEVALSVETRSQGDPFKLQLGGSSARPTTQSTSESVNNSLLPSSSQEQRDYTAEHKVVDTREFVERLNRIKQPSLQRGTSDLPHSPSIDPLSGNSLLLNPSQEQRDYTAEHKVVDTREFVERLNRIKQPSLQRGTSGSPYSPSIDPLSGNSVLPNPSQELRDYTAEHKVVDTREFVERLNRIKQPSLQRGTSGLPHSPSIDPLSGNSVLPNPSQELRDYTAEHKVVDTREFVERLNRIKQPSLQRGTSGSPHRPSIDSLSGKLTPAATVRIGGTPSLLDSATREIGLDPSAVHITPNSSRMSYFGDTRPGRGTLFEQDETIQSHSSVHQTPKPAAFFKETSFQNASSSSYEVDTSALIQRLNKIKLTQQSFTTPHYTPPKLLASEAEEKFPEKQNGVQTPSDTSLLASRLDQIKQAQKSQQVTPGSNTDGDLSTSRTSEPALLTPLTPSSRGTPSEDGTKNDFANFSFNSPPHLTSLPHSPSSPLDKSLLQTPLKSDVEFTSPFQGTPPLVSSEGGLNSGGLAPFEGLPWETATPRLPRRNANRAGLVSEEKSSTTPQMINGLHTSVPFSISSPLLVNSVQRLDTSNGSSGTKQTPASLSAQDIQDASPRLDLLASPYSTNQGNVSSHVTPSRQDSRHSPAIGQLIDFE